MSRPCPPSIAGVRLENPVVLAPMAGVTNMAFRLLVKEQGCALVYTEMISARALLQGNPRTRDMLRLSPAERPVAVQIFGSDPITMAGAARFAADAGADLVDINMGCPTSKVVNSGDGAALMRHPDRAGRIVEAVVRAVSVPVTVKIRKGWDEESANAVEVAETVVSAGAQGITVHGRTRAQFYSGRADWDIIRRVREALAGRHPGVAVFGNGDVFTPRAALALMEYSGCHGVMVGRAALGDPWIFRRIVHFLETGEELPGPAAEERIQVALRHLELLAGLKGECVAVREMKKHASWYIKGLPGAAAARVRLQSSTSRAEIQEVLSDFLLRLAERGKG